MLFPLLVILFNHWMEQVTILRRFIRDVVKLQRKNKHSGEGIGNFQSLIMLKAELKIWANVLASRLRVVLNGHVSPEQLLL